MAQSPEVLAQLLKDNQARGVCPSVYTTPASPFNTLAVQFQEEDKVLTTAPVSDLPFFDSTSISADQSPYNDTQSLGGGDSTLSEANLDSIDSSDTISPMMSSLNLSEPIQTQSPASSRKQRKIKEMQNLYSVSSKVVGSITGDLYSPVQKFSSTTTNPSPITTSACGEIYGPVANFTQSSAIMSNFVQAPISVNYCENPGNYGPSSLNSAMLSQSSGHFVLSMHAQNPVSMPSFSSNCSISSASSACVSSTASSSNYCSGGGGVSSISTSVPTSGVECLYGPVLKFRAQTAQSQNCMEIKQATPPMVSHMQNARNAVHSPTPGQTYQQQQPIYVHNFGHQQIYSNVGQPGQPMYVTRSQLLQNSQKQNVNPAQFMAHQMNDPNPIYTVHAMPSQVIQAQKLQQQNFEQQNRANYSMGDQHHAMHGHVMYPQYSCASQQSSNQHQYIGQVSDNFLQQNELGQVVNYGQVGHMNVMPQNVHVTSAKQCGPQIATGIARITTNVGHNKSDEQQLTSSVDGTISGSLVSSAVSDSTMSSSGSMMDEAQQEQVWPTNQHPRNFYSHS